MTTRFGGRFVQSIDGLKGAGAPAAGGLVLLRERRRGRQGRRRVGGLAGRPDPVGLPRLGRRDARAGDRGRVPGAVPSGFEGKRRPVRVECDDAGAGMLEVKDALGRGRASRPPAPRSARPAARQVVRAGGGRGRAARRCAARPRSRRGPRRAECSRASRATAAGSSCSTSTARRRARGAAPASGSCRLRRAPSELVWLVTGARRRGRRGRRAALDEHGSRDAFAVAATPRRVVKLPLLEEGR